LKDQRRRRWSPAEKAALVRRTYEPGMSVSLVARQEGVAASLLFQWRKLDRQGALTAVSAGEAVVPASELVEGGMAASGLIAHTLISRCVDHLPYYRQEAINGRSGVHTPRSTLAAWAGQAGAALEPLYEVHKAFILACRVLHADETPVALPRPRCRQDTKGLRLAYARAGTTLCPAWSMSSAWAVVRSTRRPSSRAMCDGAVGAGPERC
jgi:hypothetical protein